MIKYILVEWFWILWATLTHREMNFAFPGNKVSKYINEQRIYVQDTKPGF